MNLFILCMCMSYATFGISFQSFYSTNSTHSTSPIAYIDGKIETFMMHFKTDDVNALNIFRRLSCKYQWNETIGCSLNTIFNSILLIARKHFSWLTSHDGMKIEKCCRSHHSCYTKAVTSINDCR